jgi:hypothetical protein
VSDDQPRSYLPWVMAGLVLVIGGAKLEAARPLVARVLSLAIPIVPIALGVKRVEGGARRVERSATAVGWLIVLAAELCVLSAIFHVGVLTSFSKPLELVLTAAIALSLVPHLLEAKSQGKARFAGYAGIAAGFGLFLLRHVDRDPFAAVFGAFFVGVLVGGSALLVGELLARLFVKTS